MAQSAGLRTRVRFALKRRWVKSALRRPLPLSLVQKDYVCPLEIESLGPISSSSGKIFCNINFDDLYPRYDGPSGLDFGGDTERGLSAAFSALLARFPTAAFTVFVVPIARIAVPGFECASSPDYFDISAPRHSAWLTFYKDLAARYSIEYGMHGCYHRQYENELFGRHAEFAFKSAAECESAIDRGLRVFVKAGLGGVSGFRQPGWDLNSDLPICGVLQSKGFAYFAGSSEDAGLNAGRTRISNEYPSLVGGLLHFPQNICLDWDLAAITRRIQSIVERRGVISIKGHYVNRGMTNSLTAANLSKLRDILEHLETHYQNRIEYLTFRDLAARLAGVKKCASGG